MARIRTIKPEFWDSPDTSKASPYARLLYIAMWNWADDWGIGDANPRRLLGFAFPSDDASEVQPRNFRGIAEELHRVYGVQWYEAGGREYYAIPSWEDHQRTEKRAKRRSPTPDQAERVLYAETAEVPTLNRGSSGVGTGEQGNRGTPTNGSLVGYDRNARDDDTPIVEASIPKHILGPDWTPTNAHKAYAYENNLDVAHETRQFRAHHRAQRTARYDWDAEFEKWLGNARPRGGSGALKKRNTSDRVQDGLNLARELAADGDGPLQIGS